MPIQYTNPLGIPFHVYQLYAKQFVLTHPYCALWLDCGHGKTLVSLAAIYELNPHGHVLVIAPKNISRSTWVDEIEKWKLPLRTKSLLVNERGNDYSRKTRHKLYNETLTEPPTIYFINREKIEDLVNNLPRNEKNQPVWPFPMVIIDEAQSFKSYDSNRFKALKKVRPCIQRLVELTGTPKPKGIEDIWSQIYLLDQGQRLGSTITEFRTAYCRPGMIINNRPVDYQPLPGAEDYIHNLIKDIVISTENTELKLPELTFNDITIHMTQDEIDAYKEFTKTKVLEIQSENEDETISITAANSAVLSMKLSQMASGAIYTDDKHNYELIHEHKAEHCEYIIENTNSPVLIAYHFKSDADILMKYFEKRRKAKKSNITPVIFDGSPEMKNAWNTGKYRVMLINPASSGHGLNIQDGGHTLIFYTIPWSLELYTQVIKRLHRQGQKHPVVVHHLLTQGTIDSRILDSVRKKDVSEKALLEAVRVTIEDMDTI